MRKDDPRRRPLSSNTAVVDENGIRRDDQGRRLCHAHRGDGTLCMAPAVRGMQVCRMHGGGTQKAKAKARLRLAALVDPAVATLAREMANADASVDRQRAANSILDRSGIGRQDAMDADIARELLMERLLELRARREPQAAADGRVDPDELELEPESGIPADADEKTAPTRGER